MFRIVFVMTALVVLLPPVPPTPASAATFYTWHESDGSVMFTDSPKGAPPGPPVSAGPGTQPVTQGEFAVQLAEELGLSDDSDARAAADILSQVRIAPQLGRWNLDDPLTPELTYRLRRLTAAAAEAGWITVTPEQGLLAFDAAAALLGVTVPPDADTWDQASRNFTVADSPPLIYEVAPPPDLYPYYVWTPLAGGFWRHNVLVTGVFVLDTDRFFRHHRRHRVAWTRPHHANPIPPRVVAIPGPRASGPDHPLVTPPPRAHRQWRAPDAMVSSPDRARRQFSPARPATQTVKRPASSPDSHQQPAGRALRRHDAGVDSPAVSATPAKKRSVQTTRSFQKERGPDRAGPGRGQGRGFARD